MPTDAIFYLTAFVAVTFLGLAKGGFAGVGLVATPVRITPTEIFYRIAYGLVFLIAFALIESSVRDLWFPA